MVALCVLGLIGSFMVLAMLALTCGLLAWLKEHQMLGLVIVAILFFSGLLSPLAVVLFIYLII